MKLKLHLILVVCLITTISFAQIGIGTTSPDASSVLDMTSTTKGVLIPRMTTVQRAAIATPALGLQVYDTDSKAVWSYNGTEWVVGTGGPGKFVDGATSDIAYYNGRVGIGINTFSTTHKLWVQETKTSNAANTPVNVVANYNGTGTSTSTYGLGATARNQGTATINYAIGTQGVIQNSGGGTINIGVGSWPQVYNSNSGTMGYAAGAIAAVYNTSGTITTAVGMDSEVDNSATMHIDDAFSSYININNAGTIDNAYGAYIDFQGAGTVTNAYGLYITSNFDVGTTDNFAIYSNSDADSFITGNVGIGITAPLRKLHISEAMRLEPQATAPTGGSLGDLYTNTDGNLYFHDGTGWRPVQLGAIVP
tara:strand:+ start:71432 stop:72526 length:1095 start_codon:yes stop_codon:yes gene_type:complete